MRKEERIGCECLCSCIRRCIALSSGVRQRRDEGWTAIEAWSIWSGARARTTRDETADPEGEVLLAGRCFEGETRDPGSAIEVPDDEEEEVPDPPTGISKGSKDWPPGASGFTSADYA